MTKSEFLAALRRLLSGLPQEDVEERMAFYAEMIDDSVEEGVSEEEAVAAIGSVEEIAAQIVADTPLTRLVSVKIQTNRRLSALEIVLLVLGSPIWLALLISAFAVALSLYVVLWSVVVSLWSVFVALAASALGVLAGGVVFLLCGHPFSGLACIAAALVCAGLSIFAFFGCKAATKGAAWLTKQSFIAVKKACLRKEAAE